MKEIGSTNLIIKVYDRKLVQSIFLRIFHPRWIKIKVAQIFEGINYKNSLYREN